MKKLISAAMAAMIFFFCGTCAQARGQRMVTLPQGLNKLDIVELEARIGTFDAVAITIPPPGTRAVLYLDGAAVEGYLTLNREQLGRVWVFAPEGAAPVSVGMLPLAPPSGGALGSPTPDGGSGSPGSPEGRWRIRCINPVFSVNNRAK